MKYYEFFSETFSNLQKDFGRLGKKQGKVSLMAIYFESWRNPVFGNIIVYRFASNKLRMNVKLPFFNLWIRIVVPHQKCVEINPHSEIGEGLVIYHGFGLVVGSGVKSGKYLTLGHGVTLGNRIGGSGIPVKEGKAFPILGDNCYIGSGAAVLGPIVIGNNVKVGSNAVVIRDVSSGSTVVGVPAHVKSVHGTN